MRGAAHAKKGAAVVARAWEVAEKVQFDLHRH
jgi:hypothetical protein